MPSLDTSKLRGVIDEARPVNGHVTPIESALGHAEMAAPPLARQTSPIPAMTLVALNVILRFAGTVGIQVSDNVDPAAIRNSVKAKLTLSVEYEEPPLKDTLKDTVTGLVDPGHGQVTLELVSPMAVTTPAEPKLQRTSLATIPDPDSSMVPETMIDDVVSTYSTAAGADELTTGSNA